ncbi:hypothetical protein [Ruminococcus sp. YE282]|uniref:hypothetical protein n=1 Tax=Ruminococcus sp. YE282 TaxID=3158780 RepID=UPI0008863F8F|nr:hypothetical protein SAMN02910441_01197 [Ruminococcus bromii]
MNNQRRKQIKEVQNQLSEIRDNLNSILCDEDEYLCNMPEGLFSSSKKSMVAQENVGDLQFSVDAVDELIDTLKGVVERKHI